MYVVWVKIRGGEYIFGSHTSQHRSSKMKCLTSKYLWTKVVKPLTSLVQAHRTREGEMCHLWHGNDSLCQLCPIVVTW